MEYIIFGSPYTLSQFTYSKRWFLDGTFKNLPSGFYQLISILVDSNVHSIEIPVVYILMSGKSQFLYHAAFMTLQMIWNSRNLEMKPEHIMTDAEASLNNALQSIFPNSEFDICFFHAVKAIWRKASKLGLRTSTILNDTRIIIIIFKIIMHLPFVIEMLLLRT